MYILFILRASWKISCSTKCCQDFTYLLTYLCIFILNDILECISMDSRTFQEKVGKSDNDLLPAHPASFAHKFLFQRVPVSPEMQ